MYEQTTTAFVLAKEGISEYDCLVSLYTKDMGKVLARVTSGSKIKSKLMPHLQVGNKVSVRLVERNAIRVADALAFPAEGRSLDKRLNCVSLLFALSSELGADNDIWIFLESGIWSSIGLLKVLGLYSDKEKCFLCKKRMPDYFSLMDSFFYCAACCASDKGEFFCKLF